MPDVHLCRTPVEHRDVRISGDSMVLNQAPPCVRTASISAATELAAVVGHLRQTVPLIGAEANFEVTLVDPHAMQNSL
jgi:hypothetical protein